MKLAGVDHQLFSLCTEIQPLESPEKISHLSSLVRIPEFFQGRSGTAGMNKQMECMVCRAQIMLADGGRERWGVPEI